MNRLPPALGAGALVLALLSGCTAATPTAPRTTAAAGPTFENPIIASGADPWVVKDGDRYWSVQAEQGRLVVTRSPEKNLTDIASGTATTVWTPPTDGSHCTDLWAPELHRIGDRWWIYYAATTCDGDNAHHRMFALESTTDDPAGRYVDRGQVRDAAGRWAIDGTRVEWRGTAYFVWSGWPGAVDGRQDLYIARMSAPTALVGTGVRIAEADLPWEQVGAPIEEGPEALVHDDVLHLVYSASGSWTDSYALGMLTLTGDDPLDPASWTKAAKPVFAGTETVTSPGHASFTTSPDGREHWIVFHEALFPGAGWDREVSTQPFTFGSDGTPRFGRPVQDRTAIPVPSGQQPAG